MVAAHAQVVPSATEQVYKIRVGGLGSVFQPDYAGEGVAQTSPLRLYGVGAYADVRFNRWAQVEAEARWLRFNEYLGIDQNSYSIGPRIPIINNFHKFTPYGKFLVGFGTGTFLTGDSLVLTAGAGVDYRQTKKFTIRPCDFEYQEWRVVPTIYPYGLSAGISYKIF